MRLFVSMRSAAVLAVLAVSVLSAGCNIDREQVLIGKWQGDPLNASFASIKLREDTPGASIEDATNAAKILNAAFVELKQDKTFVVGLAGNTMEGAWTFNKESGEVLLKIAKTTTAAGTTDESASTWTAMLDPGNDRLGLYPGPPEAVAAMKGTKGALVNGISLYKK